MLHFLVSDDAFLDLFILLEKVGAVLGCITEDLNGSRDKTLACIASDYVTAMGDQATEMQKNLAAEPAA